MRSTYLKEDVELLLKDITGLVEPQSTEERERLIQGGRHYCEMLPVEYMPSKKYMQAYEDALRLYADSTAAAVGNLADKIISRKGNHAVLVSLARAGIPVGILLKRYINWKYGIQVKHYSISIIRGKGIDKNAVNYILKRHLESDIVFVDGWIGKGAILRELEHDLEDYPGISPDLAVLADPANITDLCGTHEDILIPSSCLNCTVSGLISRTFLRDDIIKENDFHGAVYYEELKDQDLSYAFIQSIEQQFKMENTQNMLYLKQQGLEEVKGICRAYHIHDINLVKPGIGETTRVLLRRIPWKILINEKNKHDITLTHILRLAEEKEVEIEFYPLENYKACGIIKNMADT